MPKKTKRTDNKSEMVTLKEFVMRLNKLDSLFEKPAQDILIKHQGEIIALANSQLAKGQNIEGQIMQKGYSIQYGKLRQKKGLQIGFVDLKFTGKYQKTKKLVKYNYGIDIRSAADYEPYLRGHFPNHIGLDKENAEKAAEIIKPDLSKLIKKILVE